MSPPDPLAPDQRAVVNLILQQGRSYDDIAQLLGLPVAAVRSRAHAGLDALAPRNGLPGEITGPLADYLLGQQADRDAEATRGLLAESAPLRDWAAGVAASLADVAPAGLPEIPGTTRGAPGSDSDPQTPQTADDDARGGLTADTAVSTPQTDAEAEPAASPPAAVPEPADTADEPPAPRPRPVRDEPAADPDAPAAASRLGGALLILAVLAVVAVVLFLVLRGGDDDPGDEQTAAPAATATATPTATAQPQVADEIELTAPGGGKPKGTMTVYLQGDQLLFAIQGEQLPASGASDSYAVWLTGPGPKARRLGFTDPVGKDGKLGIQGPGEKDLSAFPKLYATYANVVVSRESDATAKRPTDVVLSGKLPSGR
jgi:hypothetical protein